MEAADMAPPLRRFAPSRGIGRARCTGDVVHPAAQNEQWWIESKLVQTCGCVVTSDSTPPPELNDGHGTAADDGSPLSAKFTHAVRMLAASASWSGLTVDGAAFAR